MQLRQRAASVAAVRDVTGDHARAAQVGRGRCRSQPAGAGRRVYQHAEIAWGPFERRLRLGVSVDAEAASAAYVDGILRIALGV